MLDQSGGRLAAGEPGQQVPAEGEHFVVPTVAERFDVRIGKMWALFSEEPGHQFGVDRYLSGGNVGHRGTLAISCGRCGDGSADSSKIGRFDLPGLLSEDR